MSFVGLIMRSWGKRSGQNEKGVFRGPVKSEFPQANCDFITHFFQKLCYTEEKIPEVSYDAG